MATSFAEYLPHFGRAPGGRAQPFDEPDPGPDVDQLVAEAEGRGRAAGAEAARVEFEALRAEDLAGYERRLAEERARWVESESNRLDRAMTAAMAGIETAVLDGVTRVLSPFLELAVRERALEDLARTVRAVLTGDRSFKLQVSGPEDLVTLLWRRLATHADAIEYRVSDEPDIRALADDTIIETRIADWCARLVQSMNDGAEDG